MVVWFSFIPSCHSHATACQRRQYCRITLACHQPPQEAPPDESKASAESASGQEVAGAASAPTAASLDSWSLIGLCPSCLLLGTVVYCHYTVYISSMYLELCRSKYYIVKFYYYIHVKGIRCTAYIGIQHVALHWLWMLVFCKKDSLWPAARSEMASDQHRTARSQNHQQRPRTVQQKSRRQTTARPVRLVQLQLRSHKTKHLRLTLQIRQIREQTVFRSLCPLGRQSPKPNWRLDLCLWKSWPKSFKCHRLQRLRLVVCVPVRKNCKTALIRLPSPGLQLGLQRLCFQFHFIALFLPYYSYCNSYSLNSLCWKTKQESAAESAEAQVDPMAHATDVVPCWTSMNIHTTYTHIYIYIHIKYKIIKHCCTLSNSFQACTWLIVVARSLQVLKSKPSRKLWCCVCFVYVSLKCTWGTRPTDLCRGPRVWQRFAKILCLSPGLRGRGRISIDPLCYVLPVLAISKKLKRLKVKLSKVLCWLIECSLWM